MLHLKTESHGVVVLVGYRPLGIADMIVEHHAVPFSIGNTRVVMLSESAVFIHQCLDGERVAHSGIVVYLSHTGTAHCGIIHQLIEGILHLLRQLSLEILTSHHERLPHGICL